MSSKEIFALISRRYARARKVKEAVDTFKKIEKFGMKFEVSDYIRLIDTLSKSRNVEKAQEVFDTMKKRSLKYNALIEALGKIKQFKVVWNLVSDIKHKGLLSKETFALTSRKYARARKVKEAVDASEKIEKFGMKLEVLDYNRLIDTLSKSRNVEEAQEMFDTMKKRRFVPDIKSYTIL
ncbi:pentatricopeptide repeat-containing protein At1g71060, mitochondrial [Quercus suber]|uniref:pentatricopeptide repeat-containing protein At1g71060, mitochondrial n=1 Tax=Quercus suber TaxID=58331 RepID=UPI000CE1D24B|nr:pentatricopeptide repeat-containing protein At1g71060, mitochondrial-like [Quercus suber]